MTTATSVKVNLTQMDMKKIVELAKVNKATKSLPIIHSVHLVSNGQYIAASATNLEWYASYKLDIQTDIFNVLLPIEMLKTVKPIKAGHTLDIEENTIKLDGVKFKGLDPEKYPKYPEIEGALQSLPSNYLTSLKAAALSVSKEEVRPVLTGILHRNSSIVSTDSHRLFKKELGFKFEKDLIVRGNDIKVMLALHKHLDSEQILFNANEYYIKYESDSIAFTSKLIEGTYPDVSRIIPTMFKTDFHVNVEKFQDLHKKLLPIAKQTTNNITRANIKKNVIVLNAKNDESELELEYDAEVSGEHLKIAYNANYMIDALEQMKLFNISGLDIQFTGNASPFVLGNENIMALVLPVRIY